MRQWGLFGKQKQAHEASSDPADSTKHRPFFDTHPEPKIFAPNDYLYRLAEVTIAFFEKTLHLAEAAKRDYIACVNAYKDYSEPEDRAQHLARCLSHQPALQERLSFLVDYTPSRWLVEREIVEIKKRRDPSNADINDDADSREEDPYRWMYENCVTGLCFSGGGIRSATFNLGILQGLAERKDGKKSPLECFDYLSTVSGGGYIHQWFAAWVKRTGDMECVRKQMIPLPEEDCEPFHPTPITWLRRYSSYLTPQDGFFSADTWLVGAIWLRNTFLNQLVLVSALLLVVLVPHLLAPGSMRKSVVPATSQSAPAAIHPDSPCSVIASEGSMACAWTSRIALRLQKNYGDAPGSTPSGAVVHRSMFGRTVHGLYLGAHFAIHSPLVSAIGSILFFVIAAVMMTVYLRRARLASSDQEHSSKGQAGQGIAQLIVLSLIVSGLFLTRLLLYRGVWESCQFAIPYCVYGLLIAANVSVTLAGGATGVYMVLTGFDPDKATAWEQIKFAFRGVGGLVGVFSGIAAAGATGLFLLYRHLLCVDALRVMQLLGIAPSPANHWMLSLVIGPVMFLSVPFFSQVLLAGLVGRDFPDWLREWLASVRAWSLILGLLWFAWFGVALLTAPILHIVLSQFPKIKWEAIFVWTATTLGGVLAGKSGKTQGSTDKASSTNNLLNLFAILGPYVFIAGLLILLSWAADYALGLSSTHYLVYLLPLAVFGLFGLRVDINEFSMHAFYRNRLTRCYLGATNPRRRPNPLTGFDDGDTNDTILSSFNTGSYQGPFPIVCATLNLTFGEDLAWQERKAASFAFTPLYSGYHVNWTSGKENACMSYNGYVPTRTFAYPNGGINIATAVAISGAAVSPNWGYHTNPATAFLLTMFNVRLGWWLRNPRTSKKAGLACAQEHAFDPKEVPSPRFPAFQLMHELLGSVNDSSDFVYLSDGGHFENMGLYELVRRRCRFIVICDAEEDAEFTFSGIGNAIQRCRIDFGVEIKLNLLPLRPRMDPDLGYPISKQHFVIGEIAYPERWDGQGVVSGKIIYIKSSLTGQTPQYPEVVNLPGEPGDIVNHRLQNAPFPNDSTVNQWFDEQTFESYRRLGLHVIQEMTECNVWDGTPMQRKSEQGSA